MAKRLTDTQYRGSKPVRVLDQPHTTFVITESGRKFWRYRVRKARIKFETDVKPTGSLVDDRAKFAAWNQLVEQGLDPRADNRRYEQKTFKDIAQEYFAAKLNAHSNSKHRQQWVNTITTYAFPSIGDLPITDIDAEHIYNLLLPIWTSKAETARRVEARIYKIVSYGIGPKMGHPINREWLKEKLTTQPEPTSFAALDYRDAPSLYRELQAESSVRSAALRWILLTGCRAQEALQARYDEIDDSLWRIPPERIKTRKPHNVPLTEEMALLLEEIRSHGSGSQYLFPSPTKPYQAISLNSLDKYRKQSSFDNWTTHGLRATFKTWAEEQGTFSTGVIESGLAHSVKGIEKHYMRGEYLELRRELMEHWHEHLRSEL